jgi:hypothetical protein
MEDTHLKKKYNTLMCDVIKSVFLLKYIKIFLFYFFILTHLDHKKSLKKHQFYIFSSEIFY